jgi:hypothetical protein
MAKVSIPKAKAPKALKAMKVVKAPVMKSIKMKATHMPKLGKGNVKMPKAMY